MSKSNDSFIDEQEFRHKELLETSSPFKVKPLWKNDREELGMSIERSRSRFDDPHFSPANNPLG